MKLQCLAVSNSVKARPYAFASVKYAFVSILPQITRPSVSSQSCFALEQVEVLFTLSDLILNFLCTLIDFILNFLFITIDLILNFLSYSFTIRSCTLRERISLYWDAEDQSHMCCVSLHADKTEFMWMTVILKHQKMVLVLIILHVV